MKIAICIPALMRTYKKLYHNQLINLFEPNNADIFIYTSNFNDQLEEEYDIEDFKREIKSVYGEKLKKINIVTNEFIDNAILNSRHDSCPKISLEKIMKNVDKDPGFIKRKHDWINFYRTHQCNNLVKEYEKENNFKYDFIIKFRPDLQLYKKLNLSGLDLKDNFLYTFGNNKDQLLHEYKKFGKDFLKESFFSIKNNKYLDTRHFINTPFSNMFVFAHRDVYDIYSQTYFEFGKLSLESANDLGKEVLKKRQEYQIKLNMQKYDIGMCNIMDYPSAIIRDKNKFGYRTVQKFINIFGGY